MAPGEQSANLDFRPSTYWESPDAILANIKGEQRREFIKRLLKEGKVDELRGSLLSGSLPDEERTALGRLHPVLMGGEYLPDYQDGECEIARVALKSTTGDVTSIRARRDGRAIRYRIVDEYETEFACTPSESTLPLSLREIIQLIDSAHGKGMNGRGLTDAARDANLLMDTDPERLVDFVTVSSFFYPDLERYYELRMQTWLANVRARLAFGGDPAREAVMAMRDRGSWPLWLAGTYTICGVVLCAYLMQDLRQVLLAAILLVTMGAITVVNLKTSLILDKLTLPGLAAGLVLTPLLTGRSVSEPLGGIIVGGGIFFALILMTRGEFGGGTMKVGAMIGAFLGWQLTIVAILLSILAFLPAAPLLRRQSNRLIPVAPFLTIGATLSLLFGRRFITYYLLYFS